MKFTKIIKFDGGIVIKNDKGNIVYQKYPDGTEYKWEYKYNDKGNIVYKKDPDGTEYKWDDKGYAVYQKDPGGTEYKEEIKTINAKSLEEAINS